MSYSALNVEVARLHARELQAEAGLRRLARVASCCKPSYLAARFTELRERLTPRPAAVCSC
jgi:hypothetical protein